MKKVDFVINLDNQTAMVTRNCVEKYARKLLQDYLKKNTKMPGGWNVVKDFDNWDDPDFYNFKIYNIFFKDSLISDLL
jgi:hypothetical protein